MAEERVGDEGCEAEGSAAIRCVRLNPYALERSPVENLAIVHAVERDSPREHQVLAFRLSVCMGEYLCEDLLGDELYRRCGVLVPLDEFILRSADRSPQEFAEFL